MAHRIYNFSAGPSTLPLSVLERVQKDFIDFRGSGMSIIEMSHRGKIYEKVHAQTGERIKRLCGLSADYEVLFMTGGASMQFSLVPMNFLPEGQTAEYINTGLWSQKAIQEAKILKKQVRIVASSEDQNFNYLPKTIQLGDDAAYVHLTSNNTVFGTQFRKFPKTTRPLIADMSSDILSRWVDFGAFSLIYAGAQKNMGPSGVCIVIARKAFIESGQEGLPSLLSYRTYLENQSLANTPPTFAIYMVGLVMEWLEEMGGVKAIEKINEAKAAFLSDYLDKSDFYRPTVKREDRSLMNITFLLPSESLEKKFLQEAEEKGFSGLKGHRSVGGLRASIYNAFPMEGVHALVGFMEDFRRKSA